MPNGVPGYPDIKMSKYLSLEGTVAGPAQAGQGKVVLIFSAQASGEIAHMGMLGLLIRNIACPSKNQLLVPGFP